MTDFARCEVISFEVLGTLVDWDQGLAAALSQETGVAHSGQLERLLKARFDVEWELVDEALEFRPYREVLAESLQKAAALAGTMLGAAAARRIASGAGAWPLFPDVESALMLLGRRRRLALVTNLDRDDAAQIARRLGVKAARIVTAGDLRAYKPAPELLLALLHELELDEDQLLHVSALPEHDLYTAEDLGVPAVFLDRKGESAPDDVTVALQVRDLATLAERLTCSPVRPARRSSPGVARTKRRG